MANFPCEEQRYHHVHDDGIDLKKTIINLPETEQVNSDDEIAIVHLIPSADDSAVKYKKLCSTKISAISSSLKDSPSFIEERLLLSDIHISIQDDVVGKYFAYKHINLSTIVSSVPLTFDAISQQTVIDSTGNWDTLFISEQANVTQLSALDMTKIVRIYKNILKEFVSVSNIPENTVTNQRELISSMTSTVFADTIDLEITKAVIGQSLPSVETIQLGSATATEAGLMSADDKTSLEGKVDNTFADNVNSGYIVGNIEVANDKDSITLTKNEVKVSDGSTQDSDLTLPVAAPSDPNDQSVGSAGIITADELYNLQHPNADVVGYTTQITTNPLTSTFVGAALDELTERGTSIEGQITTIANEIQTLNGQLTTTDASLETANESLYGTSPTTTTTLDLVNVVGTFDLNEQITDSTSGATATISEIQGDTLTIINIVGTFNTSDNISGDTSGATADVDNVNTITTPGTEGILIGPGGPGRLNSIEDLFKTGTGGSALASTLADGDYKIHIDNGVITLITI